MDPEDENQGALKDNDTFGRGTARRWAKSEADKLGALLSEARQLRDEAAFRLHDARDKRRRDNIERRLSKISVEELLPGAQNVRRQNLYEHGIRTAADVWRLGEASLTEIPQIGPKTAARLLEQVAKAAATRKEDLIPTADPSSWLPSDLDLIRMLRYWNVVAPLFGLPVSDLNKYLGLLHLTEKACGWFRWLFSGREAKQGAKRMYARARSDTETERANRATESLMAGLQQVAKMERDDLSDSALRDVWRDSSADLIASLEQFIAQESADPADREVLGEITTPFGLHPDLLLAMDRQDLKTHLLRDTLRLRIYQTTGAKFALAVQRGILGDEMGLGKTIQALLCPERERTGYVGMSVL